MEAMKGIASYNDIAILIENENGTSISRQAIWKKVTEQSVEYYKLYKFTRVCPPGGSQGGPIKLLIT